MQNRITRFADSAEITRIGRNIDAQPVLATPVTTTATTAVTCITAAFGSHDSERNDVTSSFESDETVDGLLKARVVAMSS
ncbi:hypothetical protein SAMN04489751_1497 [Brevibacterium sandarakinum]|uniref:Uncharacterized protein n=1 Tax=Brevibacterium sandarakinum TaxID=629680 RepID=A0A1H1QEY6_BRESA|nr:hypothetical protein [Brevibacterium sandarakinum]MDN5587033.1 hypothetical protein [Brevibacterium sp.]SDS21459.1 hypothetical protein SAMN04489751_1497 [Brevibacterium sandarakinum]